MLLYFTVTAVHCKPGQSYISVVYVAVDVDVDADVDMEFDMHDDVFHGVTRRFSMCLVFHWTGLVSLCPCFSLCSTAPAGDEAR